MVTHKTYIGLAYWLLVSLGSFGLEGSEEQLHKIKSSYIYNFLKYVHWDQDPGPRIDLVVVSNINLYKVLKKVEKKKIWNKNLSVRHIEDPSEWLAGDDVIIFSDQASAWGEVLKQKGVLSIGDAEGFIEKGGMIQFYGKDGRIHFYLSRYNGRQQGIKFGSKLLKLADVIRGP
jgi:hypothetical protein